MPSLPPALLHMARATAPGEADVARAGYAALSMTSLMWLAFVLGWRVQGFRKDGRQNFTVVRWLVIAIHILSMCFTCSSAILISGLGMKNHAQCFSAIMVCVGFYFASKIFLYAFLVERLHVLRDPFKRRLQDKSWIVGMLSIGIGFTTVGIMCFIKPTAEISPNDGQCRIGLRRELLYPALACDIAINLTLTAAFVYVLRPMLSFTLTGSGLHTKSADQNSATTALDLTNTNPDRVKARLKKFVWKTLIGSIVVMIPITANIAIMARMNGHEQSWLCLSLCSIDVTFVVTILHWLSARPQEAEHETKIFREIVEQRPPPRSQRPPRTDSEAYIRSEVFEGNNKDLGHTQQGITLHEQRSSLKHTKTDKTSSSTVKDVTHDMSHDMESVPV